MPSESLTEQQKNWMAKVAASLETSTGKSLAQWVEIAKQNPETKPRARVTWMKANHGLGQNYAMMVLHAEAESRGEKLRDSDNFRATLWGRPGDLAVLEAIEAQVQGFEGLVTGQRTGFTAWSRKHQFAAARPAKGAVRLGLALPMDADPRLEPAKNEGWSERLLSALVLTEASAVDAGVAALLKAAWARS